MSEQVMSERVELPWLDEPVELAEAVELVAQAGEDDGQAIRDVAERIDYLERRVGTLVDASSVECPSCGATDPVSKAGVGAAQLAARDALSDANVAALNSESHVCIDCAQSFTPQLE